MSKKKNYFTVDTFLKALNTIAKTSPKACLPYIIRLQHITFTSRQDQNENVSDPFQCETLTDRKLFHIENPTRSPWNNIDLFDTNNNNDDDDDDDVMISEFSVESLRDRLLKYIAAGNIANPGHQMTVTTVTVTTKQSRRRLIKALMTTTKQSLMPDKKPFSTIQYDLVPLEGTYWIDTVLNPYCVADDLCDAINAAHLTATSSRLDKKNIIIDAHNNAIRRLRNYIGSNVSICVWMIDGVCVVVINNLFTDDKVVMPVKIGDVDTLELSFSDFTEETRDYFGWMTTYCEIYWYTKKEMNPVPVVPVVPEQITSSSPDGKKKMSPEQQKSVNYVIAQGLVYLNQNNNLNKPILFYTLQWAMLDLKANTDLLEAISLYDLQYLPSHWQTTKAPTQHDALSTLVRYGIEHLKAQSKLTKDILIHTIQWVENYPDNNNTINNTLLAAVTYSLITALNE